MDGKDQRKKEYKRGIDGDAARRAREETSVEIRKAKRDEHLSKKRSFIPSSGPRNAAAEQLTEEKMRMIPNLAAGLHSDSPDIQLECTTALRKLLSIELNPPIQAVINHGVVPRLVQFLTFQHNHKLQFEAAWALTNIASGDSSQTQMVMNAGAVQLFVQLLGSQQPDVKEQAVWALGNIAGDSYQCRDAVLKRGALPPLLHLCNPTNKLSLLRNATWTLSNFCRGKPQPPWELVRPALPVLAHLIANSRDEEVLTDACWALSYLSDDTGPQNEKIQAVIETQCVRHLVALLGHRRVSVQTPALRTVGNIVTGDDLQTQVVLNAGVLPLLVELLNSNKKGIRKEACWALSNITAGTQVQIQKVIEGEVIPTLVQVLTYAELDIKKEAAWAISNATAGGTEDQIKYLVQCGCIPPLCELFHCEEPRVITVALEGIENMLRVGQKNAAFTRDRENPYAVMVEQCGGLDYLEHLENHDNPDVYHKARHVLSTYFDVVDEAAGDVSLAPQVQGAQFGFGAGPAANNDKGFDFS